ncbi:hypothetical protein NC653_028763 [Populus alba x Populus x berolinensis]|uniref:Uncharacterized protein n=1 Tax=Populus alba x Populus x berolinensis TaxID=444605 RepID=A0AAD6M0J3_9ROSI|nr:hypothetical protein NC653_028763 [Populus alba x Populus x berolinensis]
MQEGLILLVIIWNFNFDHRENLHVIQVLCRIGGFSELKFGSFRFHCSIHGRQMNYPSCFLCDLDAR